MAMLDLTLFLDGFKVQELLLTTVVRLKYVRVPLLPC